MVNATQALAELKKEKKRKFVQTVDLVINFQKFDARKTAINTFVKVPNSSEKKICAFLTKRSKLVDTITKEDFDKYKDNKTLKNLAAKYDAFIAVAPMMAPVATKFGRALGPTGKMPSPQAGIMPTDDDESVAKMLDKMKKVVRVRIKENSLKLNVGKEDMDDKQLVENIQAVIDSVIELLPNKKDNIKNIMLKLTMTKPVEIQK
jgi:large subunit ribosomal protein L1